MFYKRECDGVRITILTAVFECNADFLTSWLSPRITSIVCKNFLFFNIWDVNCSSQFATRAKNQRWSKNRLSQADKKKTHTQTQSVCPQWWREWTITQMRFHTHTEWTPKWQRVQAIQDILAWQGANNCRSHRPAANWWPHCHRRRRQAHQHRRQHCHYCRRANAKIHRPKLIPTTHVVMMHSSSGSKNNV